MNEISVIQKIYDLILWLIPHIRRLPKDFKFSLGDRIQNMLYELLENIIKARYSKNKLQILVDENIRIEILRFQTRLLKDFNLIDIRHYNFICEKVNEIGKEIGGWIKAVKE